MHTNRLSYRIFPLGDSAFTIDFGNTIDETINNEVVARFNELTLAPLPGMIEAIPAYSSLTVYYDVVKAKKIIAKGQTAFEAIKQELDKRLQQPVQQKNISERLIKIPVCYEEEYALDMRPLTASKNISAEEVVRIHTAVTYKVYMLGFLPGFAYMGEVDERIAVPRKSQPVTVMAGSVGIAGRQTGIYPFASPGGWSIIGRTPLTLFDAYKKDATLLRAGDIIQFYSISKSEFYEIQNSPLPGEGAGDGV
jgi:inhibitor of KinA